MRKSEPPLPEHTADDDAEPIPRQLIDAWQRGESRLFQSVLWDPESYRRSVELVGIVLEHLRGAGPGSGPLIAAAAPPPGRWPRPPPARPVSIGPGSRKPRWACDSEK